jgi:hypothetical protein
MIVTRELQYAGCHEVPPVELGPMASQSWYDDPRHLGFVLARYKFVAKMLEGTRHVAEIGCGDGFGARIVKQTTRNLDLYDFDPAFKPDFVHDIVQAPLPNLYDAVFMLDVFEHIHPKDELKVLDNVCASLRTQGVFIVGVPSLESQSYASARSKAGHVNCKTGNDVRALMRDYFANVFLFGMNDEVLHTGFSPMCHYLFALCCTPLKVG